MAFHSEDTRLGAPPDILSVENLCKKFDSRTAVDNVSFSVKPGEIVGLLGPNGAGKTTIINMLLGLLSPSSGSINFFGKDFQLERDNILNEVNFAASYAQLPSNLRVYENLYVYAVLYNISRPDKVVRDAMRTFRLEELSKTKTGLLSSGEQSRLVLAKAFLNQPRLLLLDEPTSSLDPENAEIIYSRIKEYNTGSERGILWTSHNMHEVEKMCDRVLFLSHGKIILEGNPRELPEKHGTKNLEELFIAMARKPLNT